MRENYIEKYALVMRWACYYTNPNLKKGSTVLLRFDLEGLKLVEYIYRILVKDGLNVIPRMILTPTMEKDFYTYASSEQLRFIPKGEKEFFENLNSNIYIHAPSSLTHLKSVDTSKQAEFAKARKFLRDIMQFRESKKLFGWTLCTYPTNELAEQAELSLEEYTNQIVKACFLNEKDPVKKWKEVFKNIDEIKRWIDGLNIDEVRIESDNMDLKIKIGEKRKFLGGSGHNIPSFEIFTSPDARYTQGTYYANLKTFRGGNYIEKIKIEFKDGFAIKVSAEKGQEYVEKIMKTDEGARRIGEISLTDVRFSKIDKFMADILFDENYGGNFGNCHIAIGSAYIDTYKGDSSKLSKSDREKLGYNDSAIHWDLINTENKTVTAKLKNGKTLLIYEKGMFKY
ncbi:MAG: aminopeptidase [Elusimicrobiales bacterium]|nr:aminopeptidase [Elusimicrobiales bacterium]